MTHIAARLGGVFTYRDTPMHRDYHFDGLTGNHAKPGSQAVVALEFVPVGGGQREFVRVPRESAVNLALCLVKELARLRVAAFFPIWGVVRGLDKLYAAEGSHNEPTVSGICVARQEYPGESG